jgi:hypothetical protein
MILRVIRDLRESPRHIYDADRRRNMLEEVKASA